MGPRRNKKHSYCVASTHGLSTLLMGFHTLGRMDLKSYLAHTHLSCVRSTQQPKESAIGNATNLLYT